MYREELTEAGIVKQSKDGIAEIIIPTSAHCEDCTAKVYCKPVSDNDRTIIVKDSVGLTTGEHVLVSISGSKVLRISFFLYGIPLFILVLGLICGFILFDTRKEFFSTIFSFLLLAIYYLIVKSRVGKINSPFELKIINQPNHKNL